jgi:hypothetical protein
MVHYQRVSGKLLFYNNGQIPTCFAEVVVVGVGTVYSNSSCSLIDSMKTGSTTLVLVSPSQGFTIVARTDYSKIVTCTVE